MSEMGSSKRSKGVGIYFNFKIRSKIEVCYYREELPNAIYVVTETGD